MAIIFSLSVGTKSMAESVGTIELPISVDPGYYVVKYVRHETLLLRDEIEKLVIYFGIIEGQFEGFEIPCYYNVKIDRPPRALGRFDAGRNSKFTRHYLTLLGRPKRSNEVTPSHFKGLRLLCEIRDTERDWDKNAMHKNCQYSVIHNLIEVLPDTADE